MAAQRWLLLLVLAGLSAHDTLALKLSASIQPLGVRGYASWKHGQVHFQDCGSTNSKPLLLLHQSPVTHRQFDSIVPRFEAEGIRTLAVDMPGHGMSDPPPFDPESYPRIEEWSEAYLAVLDHLGVKESYVLGHHTGAAIAVELCRKYPDRFKGCILCAAVFWNDEEVDRSRNQEPFQAQPYWDQADGSHLLKCFNTRAAMYGEGWTPELITKYTMEWLMCRSHPNIGHRAVSCYDISAAFKEMKQPVVVLNPEQDYFFDKCERARDLRPEVECQVIEGAGTDCMDQQPDAIVQAAVKFINAAPEPVAAS